MNNVDGEELQIKSSIPLSASFSGWPESFEGVAFQSQSVACVNDVFEFSCPNGGTISVDFAAYGNTGVSALKLFICFFWIIFPTQANILSE